MRIFAKLFITLYLLDGAISLIDELCSRADLAFFTEARYLTAFLVLLLALMLYVMLFIDARLKKRIFVPLILFVWWCALGLWPIPLGENQSTITLLASVVQLTLGIGAVALLRGGSERLLLPQEDFQQPSFRWRSSLSFFAIHLCLLPFAAVYIGMAYANIMIQQQTSGFMRLSPRGLYMQDRSYHRNDTMVRLVAMMHIGREDYYQSLAESIPGQNSIILAEGVSDEQQLLESAFNYEGLAGVFGASSQHELQFDANLIDLDEVGASQNQSYSQKPDIAMADLDISSFDAKTIEFLNVLGRTLFGQQPLSEGVKEYNAWAERELTPKRLEIITNDILAKRNAELLRHLAVAVERYQTVVAPWGALHMPEIEAEVLKQGFVPGESLERLSLDFANLPYASIVEKLGEVAPTE